MASETREKAEAAEAAMRRHADERDRRREVESIFQLIDTDCDGYLSVSDAQRLGQMLGVAVPDRHTVNVRGISLHQFLGWVFGVQAKDHERQREIEVLQFFTFMRDKKGFVTRQRFRQWLDQSKVKCTEAELDELWEMMNGSDDARGISYDDLNDFYFHPSNLGRQ
jgi:Ca2+-binding EF-hand superfamily protein